jgi:endonuclease/exonuclease/phosphatase family metal-dependent hydrolase
MTQNLWGWHFPTPPLGIGYGKSDAWTARNDVLRDGLRALDPDLVAFQEAIRTDDYDQVRDLLGDGYHVVHQEARQADGSGATIASRWPVHAVHEVDLHLTSRVAGFPAVTLIADVEAPPPYGRLLFADHVPNGKPDFERERELQAVAAARAIEALLHEGIGHTVVGGDFSAGLDAASVRFWLGRQSLHDTSVCYVDAWDRARPGEPGHTVTPANDLVSRGTWPQRRGEAIDHVLIRTVDHGPSLEVTSCELAFDAPVGGVWASDHFGVVADLVPAPNPV